MEEAKPLHIGIIAMVGKAELIAVVLSIDNEGPKEGDETRGVAKGEVIECSAKERPAAENAGIGTDKGAFGEGV